MEAVVQASSIPVRASPVSHLYVSEEETLHCRDCDVLLTWGHVIWIFKGKSVGMLMDLSPVVLSVAVTITWCERQKMYVMQDICKYKSVLARLL